MGTNETRGVEWVRIGFIHFGYSLRIAMCPNIGPGSSFPFNEELTAPT